MNFATRARQVWTIASLQLRGVFFARRSLWVYLLALFPCVPFIGHGVEVKIRQASWSKHQTDARLIESVREGDTEEEVLAKAGKPLSDSGTIVRRRRGERSERVEESPRRYLRYYDGSKRWNLSFENGVLQSKRGQHLVDIEEDRRIYAAVFQNFYLRLAIFFGSLGIFINLFRGEMLDKTLHFWFLAPARREVLLLGKYLAGLLAATVIFSGGAMLSYAAMLWAQNAAEALRFWSQGGPANLFWYAASAALACVGYGSVFLASGLLLKNPIVPAIVIFLWESANGILPAVLQKLSILYYVQALAPVTPPMDADAPVLVRMLFSPAEPPSVAFAVFGLLLLTGGVLWIAARAVRKLEINYSTE